MGTEQRSNPGARLSGGESTAATMLATVHHRYGPPDSARARRRSTPPVAGEDEVLVHVRAASVNPRDWLTS